jgi:hypothetical protein
MNIKRVIGSSVADFTNWIIITSWVILIARIRVKGLILVSLNIHVKLMACRNLGMVIIVSVNVRKSRWLIGVMRRIIRHLNCTVVTRIVSLISLLRNITVVSLPSWIHHIILKNVMIRGKGLSTWRLLIGTLIIPYLTLATLTTRSTIVDSIILDNLISDVSQITIDPIKLSLQILLFN